jgi:methylmalonyl-CoA mutase
VVGVNRYRVAEEAPLDVLQVDNSAVRAAQLARLAQLRRERDPAAVERTLAALTRCASGEPGNLLALAVEAVRARATVGEVSLALEQVWGRHHAVTQAVTGVYSAAVQDARTIEGVQRLCAAFAAAEGRRPRLLVAKMGQDGHDRGAKVIATAFADMGFDVDIGPLFQTPEETALQAVENDVHVVGVSSLAAGHLTLVPQLKAELARLGRGDIMIVVGGVIPPQDHATLLAMGVAAVFGPGTVLTVAAEKVVRALGAQLELSLST